MIRCSDCMYVADDPSDLERHLRDYHCMDYFDWAETKLQNLTPSEYTGRLILSWFGKERVYQPFWSCVPEREIYWKVNQMLGDIKSHYESIYGDFYYQLYLVSSGYSHFTLSHTYREFRDTLRLLSLPDERRDFWHIDFVPGYPKTICPENKDGLKIVNLTSHYKFTGLKGLDSDKDGKLEIDDYVIELPEIVRYDKKHHGKHSILNPGSDRSTKRLRLTGKEDCVKFYNSNGGWKSIFRIVSKSTGEIIAPETIPGMDLIVIKQAIMRSKLYLRQVLDVAMEMARFVSVVSDSVFLKNTVVVNPKETLAYRLSWLPELDLMFGKEESLKDKTMIKISIL